MQNYDGKSKEKGGEEAPSPQQPFLFSQPAGVQRTLPSLNSQNSKRELEDARPLLRPSTIGTVEKVRCHHRLQHGQVGTLCLAVNNRQGNQQPTDLSGDEDRQSSILQRRQEESTGDDSETGGVPKEEITSQQTSSGTPVPIRHVPRSPQCRPRRSNTCICRYQGMEVRPPHTEDSVYHGTNRSFRALELGTEDEGRTGREGAQTGGAAGLDEDGGRVPEVLQRKVTYGTPVRDLSTNGDRTPTVPDPRSLPPHHGLAVTAVRGCSFRPGELEEVSRKVLEAVKERREVNKEAIEAYDYWSTEVEGFEVGVGKIATQELPPECECCTRRKSMVRCGKESCGCCHNIRTRPCQVTEGMGRRVGPCSCCQNSRSTPCVNTLHHLVRTSANSRRGEGRSAYSSTTSKSILDAQSGSSAHKPMGEGRSAIGSTTSTSTLNFRFGSSAQQPMGEGRSAYGSTTSTSTLNFKFGRNAHIPEENQVREGLCFCCSININTPCTRMSQSGGAYSPRVLPPPSYKLHIPQETRCLRVRKLLGRRWEKSAFKRWTTLKNDVIPHRSRQFNFTGRRGDKEILIEAGVIKETRVLGFPMKPFLLQEEKGGGRCRVITDVPNLNELIKGKVPARLPYVVHMYGEIVKAKFVVSIDFKCFYFQLPLPGRRATPYTFRMEGKLYRWTVVPMGVSWAVRAAQEVAEAFTEKIVEAAQCGLWNITYVDNIYVGCNSLEEVERIMTAAKEAAKNYHAAVEMEYFGGEKAGDILGINFDLSRGEARVAPGFYKKHEVVWGVIPEGKWQTVTLLRWVGVLLRALYILRRRLTEARPLLVCLADLARRQAKEGLLGTVEASKEWRAAIETMQKITAPGTLAEIRPDIENTDPVEKICYSDASAWGAGWVLISQDRIWTGAQKWTVEAGWPQVELEARAAELAVLRFSDGGQKEGVTPGRLLLILDAGALVLAEKKGHSKNAKINAFVSAAQQHNVSVAHVRTQFNIADALSRDKEPPATEVIQEEVRALPRTVNNHINKQKRSRW